MWTHQSSAYHDQISMFSKQSQHMHHWDIQRIHSVTSPHASLANRLTTVLAHFIPKPHDSLAKSNLKRHTAPAAKKCQTDAHLLVTLSGCWTNMVLGGSKSIFQRCICTTHPTVAVKIRTKNPRVPLRTRTVEEPNYERALQSGYTSWAIAVFKPQIYAVTNLTRQLAYAAPRAALCRMFAPPEKCCAMSGTARYQGIDLSRP